MDFFRQHLRLELRCSTALLQWLVFLSMGAVFLLFNLNSSGFGETQSLRIELMQLLIIGPAIIVGLASMVCRQPLTGFFVGKPLDNAVIASVRLHAIGLIAAITCGITLLSAAFYFTAMGELDILINEAGTYAREEGFLKATCFAALVILAIFLIFFRGLVLALDMEWFNTDASSSRGFTVAYSLLELAIVPLVLNTQHEPNPSVHTLPLYLAIAGGFKFLVAAEVCASLRRQRWRSRNYVMIVVASWLSTVTVIAVLACWVFAGIPAAFLIGIMVVAVPLNRILALPLVIGQARHR